MKIIVTHKDGAELFITTAQDMPLPQFLAKEMQKRGYEYGEYKLLLREKYTPFLFVPEGIKLFRTQDDLGEYL